ncbi:MAG: tetratricopeptide repeat protein [Gammaproteobacteria bacterium]|nr:tetratricopeptide repeat protein [Gammaproteobacteria bacterium]
MVRVAIGITLIWVGWSIYDGFLEESVPGAHSVQAAAKHLEDGRNEDALREYESQLRDNPENVYALRGKAQALMQMGKNDLALNVYGDAINREQNFGVTYANRGILRDRMGDHKGALADYEMALKLAPETAEGPGLMTRFLRKQPDKPPTIAERASYLREQLARPESERLLKLPEQDAKQRPYKMD